MAINIAFPAINTTVLGITGPIELGIGQTCNITNEGFKVSDWFANNDPCISIESVDEDTAKVTALAVGESKIKFLNAQEQVASRLTITVIPGPEATGLGLKAGSAELK